MNKLKVARLKDGSEMSYQEYITSRHWRAVRERYFNSKLPKVCEVCKCEQVDLHHRTYKNLGHERLMDLVPLCRKHHQGVHDSRNMNLWKSTQTYCRNERKKLET